MSDPSSNGSGANPTPVGEKVAAQLFELVGELAKNRQAQMVQETQLTGLARVIQFGALGGDGQRTTVPFGPEQGEQVANVIEEAGNLTHARGSLLYEKADGIRAAGKER